MKTKEKNDQQLVIEGKTFNKRRGVYQAIKILARDYDHDMKTVQALTSKLHQAYPTVIPLTEAMKKKYFKQYGRYFFNPEDIIVDKDYKMWVVCSQWGIGNIGNVIERFQKLKYNIRLK